MLLHGQCRRGLQSITHTAAPSSRLPMLQPACCWRTLAAAVAPPGLVWCADADCMS